jgi:hypothetical protein
MRFVGVVDDGLDPQGPAVFEVGLDAGVPVEGVDDDAVVVAVDRGAEDALGGAADLPVEDDLHVVRPADVEVVRGQGLEERPGMAGGGEGDGLGDLDLAHRDVPPVAGFAVGAGERQRQPRLPAFGEHPDLAGAEPVADLLQLGRILAGSEPVRQFFEGQARPGRLAFGPLVPVEPDLARVVGVGPERGSGIAPGPFPRPALRVKSTAGEVPLAGSFSVGLFPNRACGFPRTLLSSGHFG